MIKKKLFSKILQTDYKQSKSMYIAVLNLSVSQTLWKSNDF